MTMAAEIAVAIPYFIVDFIFIFSFRISLVVVAALNHYYQRITRVYWKSVNSMREKQPKTPY